MIKSILKSNLIKFIVLFAGSTFLTYFLIYTATSAGTSKLDQDLITRNITATGNITAAGNITTTGYITGGVYGWWDTQTGGWYDTPSLEGYDTLMVLDNKTVVYADYPGSGNETAIHLQQNGKLTIMFISFDKDPMILRLYGNGEAISLDSPKGKELIAKMGGKVSQYHRQLILLHIEKVKTSCGFGVPYYQYIGDRENLINWCKEAALSGKIKKYMGFLWKGL